MEKNPLPAFRASSVAVCIKVYLWESFHNTRKWHFRGAGEAAAVDLAFSRRAHNLFEENAQLPPSLGSSFLSESTHDEAHP